MNLFLSRKEELNAWPTAKHKDWLPDKKWANIAFTDEMSIEIGGSFGVSQVWRGNDKWDQTCVGATKKRCPTLMCWGMIGWNYKG